MNIFKREPAVILSILAAVLTAAAQLAADGKLTLAALVPIVSGIIIRQFVSPAVPNTVTEAVPNTNP